MVIEEELFDHMNLTDFATFPVDLIKRGKTKFNQKINFPCDTKQRVWEIAINNSWNTHIVQILHKKRDGGFIFKGNFISRIPKPV